MAVVVRDKNCGGRGFQCPDGLCPEDLGWGEQSPEGGGGGGSGGGPKSRMEGKGPVGVVTQNQEKENGQKDVLSFKGFTFTPDQRGNGVWEITTGEGPAPSPASVLGENRHGTEKDRRKELTRE